MSGSNGITLPPPRVPIAVRAATLADVPFIDALQKMHSHMVGWMQTKAIEGKISAGQVLIAVDGATQLGYVIGQDQYFKRDDVGIIYQLNVAPLKQRNLIGATLIKAMFDRAAYGCRLFCCWCAQDIQANYFWESIGFIPLAFRTGSASKQRIHIFWQKRIREGDATTPYWYPSQTSSGMVREDRLVFPIVPGTHWRDVMPIVLPGMRQEMPQPKALPTTRAGRPPAPAVPLAKKVAIVRSQSRALGGLPPGKAAVITAGGMRYIDRADYVPEPVVEAPKPKREKKPKVKNDPALVAKTRELRDRYLEQFNAGVLADGTKVLPSSKYEVSRTSDFGELASSELSVEDSRVASSVKSQIEAERNVPLLEHKAA